MFSFLIAKKKNVQIVVELTIFIFKFGERICVGVGFIVNQTVLSLLHYSTQRVQATRRATGSFGVRHVKH